MFKPRDKKGEGQHATLRPGNDGNGGAWDAARLDLHVPRALDGNAAEQEEQDRGGGDDGEECNEHVGVLVEFSVRRGHETEHEETHRDSDEKGPDGVKDLHDCAEKKDTADLLGL